MRWIWMLGVAAAFGCAGTEKITGQSSNTASSSVSATAGATTGSHGSTAASGDTSGGLHGAGTATATGSAIGHETTSAGASTGAETSGSTTAARGLSSASGTNGTTGATTSGGGTGSADAGLVVDLSAPTANTVTGALWGMASGALINDSFALAGDAAFQASAASLHLQLLRFNVISGGSEGNWQDAVFANGLQNPDWSYLDPWFSDAPSFWDSASRLVVGIGPGSGNVQRAPADWATMATALATHFKSMGMEVFYWEVGNEPNGPVPLATYVAAFNAIAQALHAFNPQYQVGGPVTSWDIGSYITPWAQQCGDNADFTVWHSYPINATDDDPTMYQKGIDGEVTNVPGELAGTAMAGKPLALLEYNLNDDWTVNEPREQAYQDAVFTALRLTESFKQNPLFQMGAIWDVVSDSDYGCVGGNGAPNSQIAPVGFYLGMAGQALPGTEVPATVRVSGNLTAFATLSHGGFCVQVVNYDTSATYSVSLGILPPSGMTVSGTLNTWQIGSAQQAAPALGTMPASGTITLPPATVVILTGTAS